MIHQLRILFLFILFALLALTLESGDRTRPARAEGHIFVNSDQSLGGETGNDVALGDLDGDGDLDAFVANDYADFGEANQVWFNDGNGFFSSGPTLGDSDGLAVALGDLDNDGDLDAVAGGASASQVWLNQGGTQLGVEGNFGAGASFGNAAGRSVALGDLDNDGDLDALLVGDSNEIWLNDGDATFTAGPALPYQYSRAVALADLDGDGFLDAVIADSAFGSNNRVWWNDGNWDPGPGSFSAGDPMPVESLINGVAAGDLDGDSRPDIFLAGTLDQVFWNDGARTFSSGGTLPANDISNAVALADLDGDADLDAVVANGGSGTTTTQVWRNDGGRSLAFDQTFSTGTWNVGLGLADLNGDATPDVFLATTGDDQVWFNQNTEPIGNEAGWQIQQVDGPGDTGIRPSLALDANGYPHIAYARKRAVDYDPNSGYIYEHRLFYTRWDGVRWHTEQLATTSRIYKITLVLDGDDYRHVAYAISGRAYHLSWDGTRWQERHTPVFDDSAFSFALDAAGNPHFTYLEDFFDGPFVYAFWDGAAWQTETVTTSGWLRDVSMVLDGGGSPHIVYATGEENLNYASKEGGSWQTERVRSNLSYNFTFTSLVLDGQGNPHLGYLADARSLQYAYRDAGGWHYRAVESVPSPGRFDSLALALDAAGAPHLFYSRVHTQSNPGTFFKYAAWDGTAWQSETLDYSSNTDYTRDAGVAIALDGDDTLHAAYRDRHYGDLRHVTWAPTWQIHTLPENGTAHAPAVDVQATIPSLAYYDETAGQVRLATWDDAWDLNPLDFISARVSDVSLDAGFSHEHASYYDADNGRLLYGYWDGGAFQLEVVDEAGDVGRYNDLFLVDNQDGAPRIAYWDDTSLRVKLALPIFNSVAWEVYPNNAGPALNGASGPLSATLLPGGDVGVAYYDGANGDLRLAIWDAQTTNWTDELVDGATGDAGRLNALQTDGSDGAPVLVYLHEGEIRMATKVGDLWQTEDVPPGTGGETVTGLALELGLNSRQRARIAYSTAGGALYVAQLRGGVWQTEVVESGAAGLEDVALARDSRLHLAYTTAGGDLRYALRTATLDVDTSVPGVPPPAFFMEGTYNPLDACQAVLDLFTGEDSRVASQPRASRAPALDGGDGALFGALSALFQATPGGQHYVDLYGDHGSEMGRLGLQDPALLWDAYGTLQNFMPGLEALVSGRGDEVVVTQVMVDDALGVWQRLAGAASPALASTINAELAKYNNLQDFVGMTFDEWAQTLGVTPPPEQVFLPVVVRP